MGVGKKADCPSTSRPMATYTLDQLKESPVLPCSTCNGEGTRQPYGDLPRRTCYSCDGTGSFQLPDLQTILKQIKGRKKGTLRSKRPEDSRAYYVWRLARFHGGADVTMPVTAFSYVSGDPYVPYLDAVSEAVANAVYGTDKAAAIRWAHAMGHEVSDAYLDGSQVVPPSAMPGGPVVMDGNKPYMEAAELI